MLPVSLIATVMLRAGERTLSELEIKSEVLSLLEEIREKGAHVHVPRQDLGYAVSVGLRMLTLRHIVEEKDGSYLVDPRERVLLRYYANSIAHHLERSPVNRA